jgi:hypothetical protein
VEERDPDGELQMVVAFDTDVCCVPPICPRAPVLAEQRIEPVAPRAGESFERGTWVRRLGIDRVVHRDAVETPIGGDVVGGGDRHRPARAAHNGPLRLVLRPLHGVELLVGRDERRTNVQTRHGGEPEDRGAGSRQ